MIIGRDKEQRELHEAYKSEYSEFAVVYGRRRVGKTFPKAKSKYGCSA